MNKFHPLVESNINKFIDTSSPSESTLEDFLSAISKAYFKLEEDQEILEHSLRLSLRELQQINEQMEATLKAFPDVLLILGSDGTILDIKTGQTANNSFFSPTLIGRKFNDITIPELREKLVGGVNKVLETNTVVEVEYSLCMGSKTIHFEARFVCAQKNRSKIIVIIRDVSKQKLMQMKLLQAQKLEAIGSLAAGIAHEINTPIQYVGNNLIFLQSEMESVVKILEECQVFLSSMGEEVDSSKRAKNLEEKMGSIDLGFLIEEIPLAIRESIEGVNSVTKIVKSMKEFSHPGSEEKVQVDLNRSVESTINVAKNEWKYVAELHLVLDSSMGLVPCFPADLNQVILNLVINAAHALKEKQIKIGRRDQKGDIYVRTRKSTKAFFIEIEDNALGIPLEYHKRVFDPFFTTKEVGEGTGQGLALCRSIVDDKHGGNISFNSEEGVGTIFILELPI